MSNAPGLDPPFATVAAGLEADGWAAELWDSEWRLMWVSPELKRILGEEDEAQLGYGEGIFTARLREPWRRSTTPEAYSNIGKETLRWVAAGLEGGGPALVQKLAGDPQLSVEDIPPGGPEVLMDPAPHAEPVEPFRFEFVQLDMPPMQSTGLMTGLHGADGERIGTLILYGIGIPASLGAMLTRGETVHFERMARLVSPARREAAVLFADLQGSSAHARRLSNLAYFDLIRELTTALDDLVISNGGIVGKHVGDGVTAFFLAEDAGSVSGAARAALQTARGIAAAGARGQTQEVLTVNVGVHWGGALFMGQLITGGRLEVTALGDEVNEAARLQESARDGEIVASKDLIERLAAEDAASLGIDPAAIAYTSLSELPGAGEKAVRDAGSISVTRLSPGNRG
jgi:class 3 adenylate cyclase